MNYKIISNRQAAIALFSVIFLFALGFAVASTAQTRIIRPASPGKVVVKPVVVTKSGAGVGSGTGSGVGGTTGTGTGTVNGSGMGSPSGSAIGRPSGGAAGRSTGTGTGTITGSSTGTGSGNGNGTATAAGVGTGTGTGTGSGSDTTGIERTYIKERDGRCYYVTPLGGKQFVARRRCALFP